LKTHESGPGSTYPTRMRGRRKPETTEKAEGQRDTRRVAKAHPKVPNAFGTTNPPAFDGQLSQEEPP